jgi:hypothetical protein
LGIVESLWRERQELIGCAYTLNSSNRTPRLNSISCARSEDDQEKQGGRGREGGREGRGEGRREERRGGRRSDRE